MRPLILLRDEEFPDPFVGVLLVADARNLLFAHSARIKKPHRNRVDRFIRSAEDEDATLRNAEVRQTLCTRDHVALPRTGRALDEHEATRGQLRSSKRPTLLSVVFRKDAVLRHAVSCSDDDSVVRRKDAWTWLSAGPEFCDVLR